MKKHWPELIGVAGLVALGGCATLTFKPGAGPERMAADEHSCGQAGDEGFVDCMRDLGWYVSGGEVGSSPAPAAEATPAPAADATLTMTPTATERPAGTVLPAATAIVPASVPVPKTAAAVEAAPTVAPAANITSAPAPLPTPTLAAAGVAPAGVPAGSASLPREKVGSWWKLGGSAAGLDSSIAACVAKLGTPHQPNPGATVVTVGMRECLRGDGWVAYDVKPAP